MRFRNTARFSKCENFSSVAFFAQRIDELTFNYSLDSYKAPTVNVPSLIDEAITQLSIIRRSTNAVPESAINPIIDELSDRIAGSPIVPRLIRSERFIVERLKSSSGSELESFLRVMKRELGGWAYISNVMNFVLEAIRSDKKSEIEFACRELVTSLENIGMSRAHIHFSNKEFFYGDGSNVTEIEDLRRFFEIIFPHSHEFEICLKISDFGRNFKQEHFRVFGLKVVESLDGEFEELAKKSKFRKLPKNRDFLICKGIRAFDRFAAIELAIGKANLLQNLFRFYHHKETFEIENEVLVRQCCVDGVRICKRENGRMAFVEDERPEKAAAKLEDLLKSTQLIRGEDKSRFISLAQFHGMSVESEGLENQLINLWIALETLAPTKGGQSKIANVLSAVLPVVGLRYIDRIVRRVTFDLYSWDRRTVARVLRDIGYGSTRPTERVLALLLKKDDTQQIEQLFAELKDFELLKYRLYRLHQTFCDPDRLNEFVLAHLKRVDWQIRRIYRARNSIVHLGQTPNFAATLLDNAHDYVDQTIDFVIEQSKGANGCMTFKECFDFARLEFDSYKRFLSTGGYEIDLALDRIVWRRIGIRSRDEILGR